MVLWKKASIALLLAVGTGLATGVGEGISDFFKSWTSEEQEERASASSGSIQVGDVTAGRDVLINPQSVTIQNIINIDESSFIEKAQEAGYQSPEAVAQLEIQLAKTQAALDEMRRNSPDLAEEINHLIQSVNEAEPEETRAAFQHLRARISEQRLSLQRNEAKLYHAEATLLYPFDLSQSRPLLQKAATLAETNFWYWIDYGRVLERSGALEKAAQAFRTAHDLVVHDDTRRRDYSVALNSLGDVRVAQGDGAGALVAYEESLEIRRALSAADPQDERLQRDVSISLNAVGDVLLSQGDWAGAFASYDESFDIARSSSFDDPGLRGIVVSLNRVGDALVAKGDRFRALKAYKSSLEIGRVLSAANPLNLGAQRDVSVALSKVGDVLHYQGDGAGALVAYEESLEIARALSAADPQNARWQRDVVVSLAKLARVQPSRAVDHWAEAVALLEDMAARGVLRPVDEVFLTVARIQAFVALFD